MHRGSSSATSSVGAWSPTTRASSRRGRCRCGDHRDLRSKQGRSTLPASTAALMPLTLCARCRQRVISSGFGCSKYRVDVLGSTVVRSARATFPSSAAADGRDAASPRLRRVPWSLLGGFGLRRWARRGAQTAAFPEIFPRARRALFTASRRCRRGGASRNRAARAGYRCNKDIMPGSVMLGRERDRRRLPAFSSSTCSIFVGMSPSASATSARRGSRPPSQRATSGGRHIENGSLRPEFRRVGRRSAWSAPRLDHVPTGCRSPSRPPPTRASGGRRASRAHRAVAARDVVLGNSAPSPREFSGRIPAAGGVVG